MDKQALFLSILTSRVYELAQRTTLDPAKDLSKALGNSVFLKREDLQKVFSFKLRGAYNRIAHLSPEQRAKGIICASAGNHAQGVAYSAQELGLSATIVMPRTTPPIKVRAVASYGANIILEGDSYSEAYKHCMELVRESGAVFIHPFDDPLVIAGQGTIGHELLQQLPEMDYVFLPVGGGGIAAGVAVFLKQVKPEIQVIGVEPVDSNAMIQSVRAGEPVELENIGIFADGVAVKKVGSLTYELCKELVDDWVEVETDEICSAIKRIYEDTRTIMEPAGALATAGLEKYVLEKGLKDKQLVAVCSGANMNFDRLRFVAERTMVGEKGEALVTVTIPEEPGALRRFCEKGIGERNITEFNYRITGRKEAHIFVGVAVSSQEETREFFTNLEREGYVHTDLTENDLAKNHIRHMVGGRTETAENEVAYRFEFPERPGALMEFLFAMSSNWNISLFHYRSHGGDFGRVFLGIELPAADQPAFQEFLSKINYRYYDESKNPAYKAFC